MAQALLSHAAMRSERGVSLIEAMIATTMLATALVTLAQLVSTAVSSNIAAGKVTAAVVLASQKLEELRSAPTRPPAGSDAVDSWGVVVGAGQNQARGAMFVRRWTIDAVPGAVLGTYIIQVHVEAPGRPVESAIGATRWR
jgi:Tfp pilus assembly protein PilV